AAALVHRPDALVLDEPFGGLDPVGVDVLSGVLRGQAESGVPVVFSSHQLELVERLCDSIVLIHRGRVVAAGGIDRLRASDSRRLVRIEVGAPNALWLDRLPGVRVVERFPGGGVVELDDRVREGDVLDGARLAGEIRHFSVVRRTLSEIFREVVGS
ncbi:MAG: ABC transporter ATP-binding protein, partial [Actinomycetota bacterium]